MEFEARCFGVPPCFPQLSTSVSELVSDVIEKSSHLKVFVCAQGFVCAALYPCRHVAETSEHLVDSASGCLENAGFSLLVLGDELDDLGKILVCNGSISSAGQFEGRIVLNVRPFCW